MSLQLVQGGFDFPSLVIERGQFFGGSLPVIEDSGDQPVQWLGPRDVFQSVVDDANGNPVTLLASILIGGVDAAEVGTV